MMKNHYNLYPIASTITREGYCLLSLQKLLLIGCIALLAQNSFSANVTKSYHRLQFEQFQQMRFAIHTGDITTVQQLLTNTYHPDSGISFGNTPLIHAAVHNKKEIMELLIEYNADLERHNEFGVTPFLASIMFKNLEIAQLLLQQGAILPTEETLMHLLSEILSYYQTRQPQPLTEYTVMIPPLANKSLREDSSSPATQHYTLTRSDFMFLEGPHATLIDSDRADCLDERLKAYTHNMEQVALQEFERVRKIFDALSKRLPIVPHELLFLIASFESACPLRQMMTLRKNARFNEDLICS